MKRNGKKRVGGSLSFRVRTGYSARDQLGGYFSFFNFVFFLIFFFGFV